MPKSNVRFVAVWAALVPVLTGGALLVAPLGLASWSDVQTGLAVAEVNTASAFVLAVIAYAWAHSVSEPAALNGTLSALVLSTIALGNAFAWWDLTDATGQLVQTFALAVLLLVLTLFVRSKVYAPESVKIERAKAQTPDAVFGALAERLQPPVGGLVDAGAYLVGEHGPETVDEPPSS